MAASRSFIVIAILLLLWNLLGVAAFVMQYHADLTELAKTDPVTADAFARMPGWAWGAYALAVGAGLIGAILLLARKALAAPLFLLSLIAVIVQFGYTFLDTNLIAQKGAAATVPFPAFIVAVAVAQLLYSRSQVAKRVLR